MRDWRDSYDMVRVWNRFVERTDPMGEGEYGWSYTDVRGVAVKNGAGADMQRGDAASDLRPDGVRVLYTLAFPKGHGLTLRHARVTLLDRGMDPDSWEDALVVSGDPRPQRPCPTRWDTIAEVGRTDG